MSLELHVWGPAFALPSADPQCLAAICYLFHLSHQASPGPSWTLIESNDSSASRTGMSDYAPVFHSRGTSPLASSRLMECPLSEEALPVLHNPEALVTISGFRNIVSYLREVNPAWDLDRHVEKDPLASADLTAFASHVSSQAPLLLDLSLFVSSDNYVSTTRPTYSALLPSPLQYFVLPDLRSAAKVRTSHLGLSSLDLDESESQTGDQNDNDSIAQQRQHKSLIPDSFRKASRAGGGTVTSILKAQGATTRFRLDELVDRFCGPLAELLGSSTYLLSPVNHDDLPSSLDCLVVGYLSVMLKAEVPNAWLRDGIRQRHAQLEVYAKNMLDHCVSRELVWQEPSPSGGPLSHLASYTFSRLSSPYRTAILTPHSTVSHEGDPSDATSASKWAPSSVLPISLSLFFAALVGAGGAYLLSPSLFNSSFSSNPSYTFRSLTTRPDSSDAEAASKQNSGLDGYGEAGALLSAAIAASKDAGI